MNKTERLDTRGGVVCNSERDSGIELFRIVTMLLIIAHHMVCNSNLYSVVESDIFNPKAIFLLCISGFGKTGINCFVMITGYFMCKSRITLKKFLKLFLEVEFYKISLYIVSVIIGVKTLSADGIFDAVFPFRSVDNGFTSTYILFFLFIPFINILIQNMDKTTHLKLIGLLLIVYTVLPTFFASEVTFNYITWFTVVYLIAAYIRIYPCELFEKKRIWILSAVLSFVVSVISIVVCSAGAKYLIGRNLAFFFLTDSNKFLAVLTAFCGFMCFKNINIKPNRVINVIASTAFGVLLLHANGSLKDWMWHKLIGITQIYDSSLLLLWAIVIPILIYIVCCIIDLIRIYGLEKPFFRFYDKISKKEK